MENIKDINNDLNDLNDNKNQGEGTLEAGKTAVDSPSSLT